MTTLPVRETLVSGYLRDGEALSTTKCRTVKLAVKVKEPKRPHCITTTGYHHSRSVRSKGRRLLTALNAVK